MESSISKSVSLFVLLIVLACQAIGFAEVVDIPDPNLRKWMEERLGINAGEDITKEALTGLTSLHAWNSKISDITGIEHCTNLTELIFADNQLTGLSGLTNLTTLDLNNNQISNISSLANLTNLTSLHLAGNNAISDVGPLANLTNLTNLYLNNNQISNISPLVNLTNLTDLYLFGNQVSDVSPLANLTNLRDLRIQNNPLNADAYIAIS